MPEEPDVVPAARELGGDPEGGRDVAAAVPGDEEEVAHDLFLVSPVFSWVAITAITN